MTTVTSSSPPQTTPPMRAITIGYDPIRLPSDAATTIEFVQAITDADPTLRLLRWVNDRFNLDLLGVHNQLVHMEALADETAAADGAHGHTTWLDRWDCAELELRDLVVPTLGGAA